MREYELTLIIEPDLAEKEQKRLLEKVKEWLEKGKAKIEKEEIWGKKKLAYPINKKEEGIYVFYLLKLEISSLAELEKKLKLEEKILRYLIIKNN